MTQSSKNGDILNGTQDRKRENLPRNLSERKKKPRRHVLREERERERGREGEKEREREREREKDSSLFTRMAALFLRCSEKQFRKLEQFVFRQFQSPR